MASSRISRSVPLSFPGPCCRRARYATRGSADGPGWTGTEYTFTASISGGPVSGTVYVDRQGRVRRLVTITPEGNAIPEGTGLPEGRVTVDRDLTFDDFGVQAAVTAPPASQTEYTSYPYWGFYF